MRQPGVTYIGSGFAVWVRAVVVFIAGGVLLGLSGCGGSGAAPDTGGLTYVKSFGVPGLDYFGVVTAAMPDGGAVIAGTGQGVDVATSVMVTRVDTDGNQMWSRNLGAAPPDPTRGFSRIAGATEATDGRIFVAGERFGKPVVLTYRADGTFESERDYSISSRSLRRQINDIAATPDGGYVIGGFSEDVRFPDRVNKDRISIDAWLFASGTGIELNDADGPDDDTGELIHRIAIHPIPGGANDYVIGVVGKRYSRTRSRDGDVYSYDFSTGSEWFAAFRRDLNDHFSPDFSKTFGDGTIFFGIVPLPGDNSADQPAVWVGAGSSRGILNGDSEALIVGLGGRTGAALFEEAIADRTEGGEAYIDLVQDEMSPRDVWGLYSVGDAQSLHRYIGADGVKTPSEYSTGFQFNIDGIIFENFRASVLTQTGDGHFGVVGNASSGHRVATFFAKIHHDTGLSIGGKVLHRDGTCGGPLRASRTADGGFLLVSDLCVHKVDMDGNIVRAIVDGAGPNNSTTAYARSVTATPDGGVLVAASIVDNDNTGAWLTRLNPDGGVQWQRFMAFTYVNHVEAVDGNGDGVRDEGFILGGDGLALRLDPEGNVLWEQGYGAALEKIRQTPDGGYIGLTASSLIRFDSVGGVQWARKVTASDVWPTSDGGYIVTDARTLRFKPLPWFGGAFGYVSDVGAATLTKLGPDGAGEWSKSYTDAETNLTLTNFDAVRQTSDGGYVVAGLGIDQDVRNSYCFEGNRAVVEDILRHTAAGGYYEGDLFGCKDAWLVRMTATGDLRWARRLATSGNEPSNAPVSLAIMPDNGFLVGTDTDGFDYPYHSAFLVRTDADGNISSSCPAGFEVHSLLQKNIDATTQSMDVPSTYVSARSIETADFLVTSFTDRIVTARACGGVSEAPVLLVTTTGNGIATSSPTGINCGLANMDCRQAFATGTHITLTATPESGQTFLGWGNQCTAFGSSTTASFALHDSLTCAASFSGAPPQPTLNFPLQIQVTGPVGRVTATPGGIDCQPGNTGTCQTSLPQGTVVTLNPLPAEGYMFNGWSGDPDCSDGSVTMDHELSCGADFIPIPGVTFTLSVLVEGPGGSIVSTPSGINCSTNNAGTCQVSLNPGTSMTLSPQPGGFSFLRWAGDTDCSDGDITMNGNRTCTAIFVPNFTLTVQVIGAGGVTGSAGGISCQSGNNGTCIASLPQDTIASLSVLPSPGYSFSGWSGDDDCSDASVTLISNRICIATFAVIPASWRSLGTPLNREPTRRASAPDIAADRNGQIYAAWTEFGSTEVSSGGVFVSRWDGSSWVAVGAGLEFVAGSNAATDAQIAIDMTDNSKIVAWMEGGNVYVKRWNGSSWVMLGNNVLVGTPGNNFANRIDFAIGADGIPTLAIEQGQSGNFYSQIYVRRYVSGTWITMGTIVSQTGRQVAGAPSLALAGGGQRPIIAWHEISSAGIGSIVVSHWLGAEFGRVGIASEAGTNAWYPSLTLDAVGNYIVAYTQYGGSRNTVTARCYGCYLNDWVNLTDTVANVSTTESAFEPKLVRGLDNNIYIAFSESGTTYPSAFIYVRRLNGAAWETVGSDFVTSEPANLSALSIVTTTGGGIAASWLSTNQNTSSAIAHVSGFGL